MKPDKNLAVSEWIDFIKKSWSWDRLTETERRRVESELRQMEYAGVIKGSFTDRYAMCRSLYGMFLAGTGFYDVENPYCNWRRENN